MIVVSMAREGSLVCFEVGPDSAEEVFADGYRDGVLASEFEFAHEGLHGDAFDAFFAYEILLVYSLPLQ
jgi:hypothetical protein